MSQLIEEIKQAYEKGNKPRIHPNGFLQLDLTEDRRLHIFDDHLPRQSTRTAIHDHIFDLESEVIKGTILNDEYDVQADVHGDYFAYKAVPKDGAQTELVPYDTGPYHAEKTRTLPVHAGEKYTFRAFYFHESRHIGQTVTVMTKSRRINTSISPIILVPISLEPDNDFHREEHDVEDLWKLIEQATGYKRELREDRLRRLSLEWGKATGRREAWASMVELAKEELQDAYDDTDAIIREKIKIEEPE